MSHSSIIQSKSSYLWFLMLFYTMVIVLANWFDPRLVKVFGMTTDAGTLIFPLTFLLSDLITEVYGYKNARRAIWCGFFFNILFICYGQLIIHLPSPDYPTNNANFDNILAFNTRIIIASIISYFIAESLNALAIAKLKIKMKGQYMGIRFIVSTILASWVDSVIFGCLAFYGVMTHYHLFQLIMTMWFIKVLIEIAGVPVSVSIAMKLKKIEKLDIYDKNTHCNLFTIENHYAEEDNKFLVKQ